MPLTAHFLNVGHGDCTIIEFPSGRIAMIDIDNLRSFDPDTKKEMLEEYHESSDYLLKSLLRESAKADQEYLAQKELELTDPLAYFDLHIGKDKQIFRLIIIHPDMDHMTGLHRLVTQEKKVVSNFWHTGLHDFNLANPPDDEWFRYDKRDWDTYKTFRSSQENPKALQLFQGAKASYYNEDQIEIWAPTPDLERRAVEADKANIISMVVKVSYKGKSILLGGDATSDETWPAIFESMTIPNLQVLKASHHGRKTGYHQPSVKAMSPLLTITSVGQKEHDATPNYRRYSDRTVSLRDTGDIRIKINDDGQITYSPSSVAEHWKDKIE